MKILLTITGLAVLLLMAPPVFADEAHDFINGEVADWDAIATDNGYNILNNYIGIVGSESVHYGFDLAPGRYHFYCSGGLNMTDLDTYVYSEDGTTILGSDALADKIPIVVIELRERTVVDAEFIAYSFEAGYTEDYFCVVVTAESEGEIYSFTGDAEIPAQDEIVFYEEEGTEETGDDVGHDVADSDEYEEYDEDYEYTEGDYLDYIESLVDDWSTYEQDASAEVIAADYELVDTDVLSLKFDLEPGAYKVYAEPDYRCLDLDLTVYNSNDEVIAEDHLDDFYPYVEFFLLDEEEVTIDFEVYSLEEGADETYVGYFVALRGGLDEDSRQEYIQGELDWMVSLTSETGEEVIDSGIGTISEREDVITYEYDLEAGYYYLEAEGGIAITNLDMSLYDEDGNLLDEDTYDDNFPIVFLDLAEPAHVALEIQVVDFAEGFDEDFFAFMISETDYSYTEGWEAENAWSGNDQDLIDNAEYLIESAVGIAEDYGDEIIEQRTESITDVSEENGWVYEVDLDPGKYHFYAQGDNICLNDLDMVIYDENGEIVDLDEEGTNFPTCLIDVPRRGGSYTIVVYGYTLDCEIGYFAFLMTSQHD